MMDVIERLYATRNASDEELKKLIVLGDCVPLREAAVARRREWYGTDVYIRGLIEFSNHCRNNCHYCGIRAGNTSIGRYRLTKEAILEITAKGYGLGFRTFVLQGGEDPGLSEGDISEIVGAIKHAHPDCAVTLSVGEKPRETYQAWFDAGASRYLLRHETASESHYARLHPSSMSLGNRKRCLWDLKEIGYQVGAGFMVGTPWQTLDNLVEDLRFLQELQPDMVGIGPFLPAAGTPFSDKPKGSMARTLNLVSILRLMFPHALIPSTTSLGTIDPGGREYGIEAGANVLMPNLTPGNVRQLYTLYDHKPSTDVASSLGDLRDRMEALGYNLVVDRGDVKFRPTS